ncbi:Variant surface glycoprotein [Trypanosoma congolense IL3000]|uniref:Variant surface glycoprotein n=1 Tax=Trypanosoma congolense (strain IL3000) TaxID=1068625 RepID=F9WDW1_TRYCI|nr:Variant surface glycoprotein [Trypanosoma congolense IL3000]
MLLGKFALLPLVVSMGMASSRHPSAAEFNLFCRILGKANDMMYGSNYVYNENVDRAIMREMEELYNTTTGNMNDFGEMLWKTKDFLTGHPPPTDPKNREEAHREIGKLIKDGEKKIEGTKKVAEEVNQKIEEAKLSVAKGLYGEHVTEVPKDDKNLTEILGNKGGVFVDEGSAKESCGNDSTKRAGKTLINDLFCVCAGVGDNAEGPCHPKIWPPKSWGGCTNHNCCKKGCWTQIKLGLSKDTPQLVPSFNESFQKIEHVCREEMIKRNVKPKNMDALLREYLWMIEMGDKKTDKTKKIFGHSERNKGGQNVNHVKECTGEKGEWGYNDPEKHNNKICVDYTKNQNEDGKTYNITWHEKFKNYTKIMLEAKKIEERILKNHAALLLLKSQAWVAYSREKDDETSNLDDMNMSNLFDGTKIPFSFPFLFPYLFMIF